MPLISTLAGGSARGFGGMKTFGTPYAGPFGAYDALTSVTVGATSVSSITFTGVPAGYKHLQIRFMAISARPTYAIDGLNLQFNGDNGANYTIHNLAGNGASIASGGGGGQTAVYMDFVVGTTVANYPGVGVIDILDYDNLSKNKTVRVLGGSDSNGTSVASTPGRLNFMSSLWQNTSAIHTLTFTPVNANFTQHTNFSLYGVK
jgi:hypothetical protein